jgi:hypothetical protein
VTAAPAAIGYGSAPMRLSIDAWDPAYGSSGDGEAELREPTAQLDLRVEYAEDRWQPVSPDPAARLPAAVLFVDGVRRIDARAWVDGTAAAGQRAVTASPGLCASYAAGVVCCRGSRAGLATAQVRRGLFTTAPQAADLVTRAGTYRLAPAPPRPELGYVQALSLTLQHHLAELEIDTAAVARQALAGTGLPDGDDLLVIDGPLLGRQQLPRAVGYIKTHHRQYLPAHLNPLVSALAAGQRTPVFRISSSWDRHSWYLRLPTDAAAPWAGIVRAECPADLPAAEAIALATRSQATLGRYASAEYKDPRAPQNLYPIAGLERELRRRLGDPRLLYRALRQAAAPPRR